MQSASTAYGTIVAGNDVTIVRKLTIRWPGVVAAAYQNASLAVQSVSLQRETQTDMPAGTKYVTGRAASQLDVTLGGLVDVTDETKTIAWLMGRYQSTSPMYRQSARGVPVTLDEGVLTGASSATTSGYEGVEFVRTFTGFIDDYTENQPAGTVNITCLDGRALLGAVPQMQQFYPADPNAYQTLTGEWVLDRLAAPQFQSWPRHPAALTVCSVGFRAGLWPEVGTMFGWPGLADTFGFVKGKFGSAFTPSGAGCLYRPALSPLWGSPLFIEFWASAKDVVAGGYMSVALTNFDGSSQVGVTYEPTGITVTINRSDVGYSSSVKWSFTVSDAVSHYVGMQLTWSGLTPVVTVRHDGTSHTSTFAAMSSAPNPQSVGTRVSVQAGNYYTTSPSTGFIEGVNVTTEVTSPWNDAFVPTALIDPSTSFINALPDIAGQDEWQIIQDVAAAELGVAGLDELGRFIFRNRITIAQSTPVRTLDAGSSMLSIGVQTSGSAYANHVQIPINALYVSPLTSVWQSPEVICVPTKGKWQQIIQTDNPVVSIGADAGYDTYPVPLPTYPGCIYWRACQAIDGAGPAVTTGIGVVVVQMGPNQLQVTVTNSNRYDVYLITPIGVGYPASYYQQPSLVIGGRNILTHSATDNSSVSTSAGLVADAQFPPLYPDGGAAANAAGEVAITLGSNPWRQHIAATGRLAEAVLEDLCTTRPFWSGVQVVGDARLQRGDRVTVNDPDVTGITLEDAIISDIDGPDESGVMTLNLRAVAPPGGWILEQAGRTELAVSTYTL